MSKILHSLFNLFLASSVFLLGIWAIFREAVNYRRPRVNRVVAVSEKYQSKLNGIKKELNLTDEEALKVFVHITRELKGTDELYLDDNFIKDDGRKT